MAISFSGLASGMDTSSWVEALVSVKQAEITKLESKKATIAEAQSVLSNVRSYFSSFQSLLENITDANLFQNHSTRDLFAQKIAESSNASVLTATANYMAENTTYNIEVQKLATNTEVKSGIKNTVTTTTTPYATMDTKLFSLVNDANSEPAIVEGDISFIVDNHPNHPRSIHIDNNTTISSFIDSLQSIGIAASYDSSSGVFSVDISTSDVTGARAKLDSDTSGVMAALHLHEVNTGYKTATPISYTVTTTTTQTAALTSKLSDLGITDNEDCKFTVKDDNGTITNVTTFTTGTSLEELFTALHDNYGINAEVSEDGVITFTSGTTGNVFGGNLAAALGMTEVESPYISLSKMTSTAIVYSSQETLINRDTTLGQIREYQEGDTIVIRNQDGGAEYATISSLNTDSTIQDLFNALTPYGISATISDGVVTLNSTSGYFVDGEIATKMGILHPVTDTYYTTASHEQTSSTTIDTSKTLGALGMSSDASVVIYSPVYGVVSVNIAKELTVQGFCDKINDSNYGIKAEIVNDKVRLSELENSGSYVKGMSSVLQNALELSVGEGNTYDSTAVNVYSNTNSSYIKYNDNVEIDDDTTISSILDYEHGNGEIRLHNNGVESTITVDSTLTLDEFMNNPIVGLAQYGLTGNILSDGKAYLTADDDIYLEEIAGGSKILTALKLSAKEQIKTGNHVMTADPKTYVVTEETPIQVTNGTKLNVLNRTVDVNGTTTTQKTEGTLVFKLNGYYKTVNINEDDTFGSLTDKFKANGIDAYLTGGKFYIASGYDNVEFLSTESSSKFATLVGLSGPENLGGYSTSSSPVLSKVVTSYEETLSASNYADMNTKLSTMNITAGRLTVYKDGQRKDIEIDENTNFSGLQSKLSEKFSDLTIDFDENGYLRDGILTIKSSDPNANISIGSTSDTTNFVAITGISKNENNELVSARQLYKINDRTSLDEEKLFRAYAKRDTLLRATGITAGNFKISKAGESEKTITISENDTFADLQTKIQSQFSDLSICFDENNALKDGKLQIVSTGENVNISITAASGPEASNIASVCAFNANQSESSITSKQLYQKALSGSFKVGDANIYISESNGKITTTIADIVSQINASESSLAKAYWDNIDGKLVIKSTKTGASAVNIEAGDTNFTELLGLTNGENLVMDNQTIGTNAVFTINGARYTSLSNTVTSDSTGIDGLTINLKSVTSGTAVELKVKRDTEPLKNAVQNVIDGYNELITNINSAISKSTGKLSEQTTLKLLKNDIRTTMNSADPGSSIFRNLAAIGIRTSTASANNISTSEKDIELLSLDEEAFNNALEGDPDAVKALLIGSDNNQGILVRVEELIEHAISAYGGFFMTASNTYTKQMEDVNKKIVKGTAAIEKYRKRLENKFSSMDTMIAEMQNQFSSFLN